MYMLNELMYAQGAQKLVSHNANVRENEKVLVVADYPMATIATRVAKAARACGAEVVVSFMAPREWDCQEPPSMIASAMLEADVIFSPVSVSIAWSRALRNALDKGARSILMTDFNDEIFTSPALLKTDFKAREKLCRSYADALTRGTSVTLTSPKGTELNFSIKGRKGNIVSSLPGSGETGSAPNIEVNVIPLEGTASGVVVIDECIPYLGIGILETPVTCVVESGFVVDISGGKVAEVLKANLESHNDPNCYNFAELGIGLNPNARITGTMLEDEGVLGTIHFAIGMNKTIGGDTLAPIHYDLIMGEPTIALDGGVVQTGRQVFV
jgi:leucyl aminopeptidase (aminopeptidase T)